MHWVPPSSFGAFYVLPWLALVRSLEKQSCVINVDKGSSSADNDLVVVKKLTRCRVCIDLRLRAAENGDKASSTGRYARCEPNIMCTTMMKLPLRSPRQCFFFRVGVVQSQSIRETSDWSPEPRASVRVSVEPRGMLTKRSVTVLYALALSWASFQPAETKAANDVVLRQCLQVGVKHHKLKDSRWLDPFRGPSCSF